jgi:hypothetical protein
MNNRIAQFKICCHLAGPTAGCSIGQLNREFGLGEFLEDVLTDSDDCISIAVKAVQFFCEDVFPSDKVFQFVVYAVCDYLHRHHAKRSGQLSVQAATDLVKLLKTKQTDESIRRWAESHFS